MTVRHEQPPESRRQFQDTDAEPAVAAESTPVTPDAGASDRSASDNTVSDKGADDGVPATEITDVPEDGSGSSDSATAESASPGPGQTESDSSDTGQSPETSSSGGSGDAARPGPERSSHRSRQRRPERRSWFSSRSANAVATESRAAAAGPDTPAADGAPDAPAVRVPDDAVTSGESRETPPTDADPATPSHDAAVPQEPAAAGPAGSAATMTRRELRALRARAIAAGQPAPDLVVLPSGETTLTGTFAAIDPDADQEPTVVPVADPAGVIEERPADEPGDEPVAEVESTEDASSPGEVGETAGTSSSRPDPVEEIPAVPESAGGDGVPDTSGPVEVIEAELVEPDGASASGASPTRSAPATAFRATADPAGVPAVDSHGGAQDDATTLPDRPFDAHGHWSTQAVEDSDDVAGEITLSRDVTTTTGAITTSALVLPTTPDPADQLLTPLTNTGEVMITGIVELPRSFGSSGAHPPLFDHPDVDALIDEADREDAGAAIAPVRASRAISTTSSRGMIDTAPARRSRMITMVAIAVGAAVFLVAATVVVAGYLFDAF